MGALVPGSGYLYAGRKALGAIVFLTWLGCLGGAAWYVARDLEAAIAFATDPVRLKTAALLLTVGLVVWAFVVVTSYRLIRPVQRRRWHTFAGNVVVGALCLLVAAPLALAAQYAVVTNDVITTVFEDNQTATAPRDVTVEDPWGGRERVNVLLLGGDGGQGRTGVRTDTVIVLSMDTRTGDAVTFSLPRNMRDAQFPVGSPLAEIYPDGYDGYADDATYMLNAVYGQIPILHPEVLGDSENEGADAIKLAVSGSLGIDIDYYMLVNLDGFKEVVDAIGGVTVNINEPVAIQGNTDLGIPPEDYLEPGPDQELDGFEALWFARGRWGSDDYDRMERQRCMIDAMIEAADPMTLVTRYQAVAKAGRDIVTTDIPRKLIPAFAELAMKVKNDRIGSVVFQNSDQFFSGDPDFDYVQAVVQKALEPPKVKDAPRSPSQGSGDSTESPSASPSADPGAESEDELQAPERAADACSYNPDDEVLASE